MRLRAHHLLCLALFGGAGYDDCFTANMRRIKRNLDGCSETVVELLDELDDVCRCCPNNEGAQCRLGAEDVRQKDHAVLRSLMSRTGEKRLFADWQQRLKLHITEERFWQCCGTCRWYLGGFCRYDRLMEALEK